MNLLKWFKRKFSKKQKDADAWRATEAFNQRPTGPLFTKAPPRPHPACSTGRFNNLNSPYRGNRTEDVHPSTSDSDWLNTNLGILNTNPSSYDSPSSDSSSYDSGSSGYDSSSSSDSGSTDFGGGDGGGGGASGDW